MGDNYVALHRYSGGVSVATLVQEVCYLEDY